jgi:hypothetical protein
LRASHGTVRQRETREKAGRKPEKKDLFSTTGHAASFPALRGRAKPVSFQVWETAVSYLIGDDLNPLPFWKKEYAAPRAEMPGEVRRCD